MMCLLTRVVKCFGAVFPYRAFLLFHVKNTPLQNAIRQRVEKFFEKSFKKIWKLCYIIHIFASLNIDKHYESKRVCKENGRPPLVGKAMDKRGQSNGD